MINRTVLVGRFTRDPELKFTQSGIAMCRFTLAVNRPFRNQQGENEADFINCVAWRKQAENVANYMQKGSLAGVDGRIQTSSFEGKDGNRVFMTEVVADSVQFLESKKEREGNRTTDAPTTNKSSAEGNPFKAKPSNDPFAPKTNNAVIDLGDDDLPF